jgi:F0F1-type ATP synthase assembly protein I
VEPEDNDAERGASPSQLRGLRALSPATLAARQETFQGFGDTLAVAFELAVTPFIFGLIGYGLDRWLGLTPVFTIVLVLFCIAGLSVRMWFEYDARMKAHEAAGPWARPLRTSGARPPLGDGG